MDFWRRSASISIRDKIKNEVIKNNINVKNNKIDYVKRKQIQEYDYVRRMQKERLQKKILEWISSEKRKRGRPTTSWMEKIAATMKKKNIDKEQ